MVLKLVFIKVEIQGTQGYVFLVGWNTEYIGNSIGVSIHLGWNTRYTRIYVYSWLVGTQNTLVINEHRGYDLFW